VLAQAIIERSPRWGNRPIPWDGREEGDGATFADHFLCAFAPVRDIPASYRVAFTTGPLVREGHLQECRFRMEVLHAKPQTREGTEALPGWAASRLAVLHAPAAWGDWPCSHRGLLP